MNTNNSSGDCMADDNKVFAFENSRVFFFLVLYTILLPMPPMFSRTKDFFLARFSSHRWRWAHDMIQFKTRRIGFARANECVGQNCDSVRIRAHLNIQTWTIGMLGKGFMGFQESPHEQGEENLEFSETEAVRMLQLQ